MLRFKEFNDDKDQEKRDTEIQGFMGMDAGYVGKPYPKVHHVSESFDADGEVLTEDSATALDPAQHEKFTEKYVRLRHAKQDRLEGVYGKQDKKMTNGEVSKNAVDTVKWFHGLNPAEQAAALTQARKNRKASGLGGKHLHGNTKNETANDEEINGRQNHTYGISGSPAVYPHINGNGSISNHITCPHATSSCGGGSKEAEEAGKIDKDAPTLGTGGSCLAQKAQGKQDTNRVSRDHYSQAERHSPESNRDHVLTMMHEIKSAHAKAEGENRNLLLRGDNYTNDHDVKYNKMHEALGAHIKKDGKIHYTRYGYTKNPDDKNDPENGNFKVWSNSGPFVKKNPSTGKSEFVNPLKKRDNQMTNQTTENSDTKHPMNQYIVANIRRPNTGSKRKKDNIYQAHENFSKGVTKFRSWKQGEEIPEGHKEAGLSDEHATKDEFHHPEGWGWTTKHRQVSDGKGGLKTKHTRYHYQDYDAITPSHDNRASDQEQNAGTTKTRTGGKVGLAVVSSAVSSTPHHDLEHSTMFHDVSKLDHSTGILHANHPDDQEEAEQHQERTGRPENVGVEVHSKRNLSKLGLKESSKI